MAKPPRPWIVTPHGPLKKLEENLWTIDSTVPGAPMQRRMTIIKRSDGKLAFYQAVPVDDATLAEIKKLGEPELLIVPHDQHGMDAPAFSEKLGVKMFGPKANEAKLRPRFKDIGLVEEIPADTNVTFEAVAGAKTGEPVAIVKSGDKVSLVFADAYMATPSDGLNLMLRVLGFGGGPKVAPLFKLLYVSDRAALKGHFEKLAALPGLTNLIPCHGEIESKNAAGTLRKVAATL